MPEALAILPNVQPKRGAMGLHKHLWELRFRDVWTGPCCSWLVKRDGLTELREERNCSSRPRMCEHVSLPGRRCDASSVWDPRGGSCFWLRMGPRRQNR